MESKKRVLILAFSRLKYDARVTRQIQFLKDDYDVDVFCFSKTDIAGVNFYEVRQTPLTLLRKIFAAFFLITRQYKPAYWILHNYKDHIPQLKSNNYDLIVANDVETLHLAFSVAGKTKVLFDAHEYAPKHFEDKLWFRLFFQGFNTYFCRFYIPKAAAMTTVCDGLAKEYERNFKVKPTIITNAPKYHDTQIRKTDPNEIKIIHMGVANFSRKLENMIEVVDLLGHPYSLDLMLLVPGYASAQTKAYTDTLKQKVKENPRVNIIDPVDSKDVVDKIKTYDIGMFLLEPVNFNYTFALPNKLFEFIQARLAVAIGPSVEMAKVVKKYQCGIVSADFTPKALANELKQLTTQDIDTMKANCSNAAMDLSAEKNAEVLKSICKGIIN
ncbi:hypothetical protein JMN32_18640 [Fulvivirga sp. 29W222]|uniref:Glycosyltransferase subfamily 4-like N-terminal domain-containing protein n=1 Tax=Fulvivirga marina TaxID=2494733 RepID=A0A937KFM3_9BACT|nr:hypothetical protein [Fulvivirga marina]MBL6448338.1 hypothetical protein [Fulvivirga marina]